MGREKARLGTAWTTTAGSKGDVSFEVDQARVGVRRMHGGWKDSGAGKGLSVPQVDSADGARLEEELLLGTRGTNSERT